MRAITILTVAAALCALVPTTPEAQAAGPVRPRIAPGDTVRLWRIRPRLDGWVGVVVATPSRDSIVVEAAPGEHYGLEIESLLRLELRRVEVGTDVAGGLVTGLIVGALVGGVLGYCRSGGCGGGGQNSGKGMGALVGVRDGAALGALVFGALGARERPRGRWVRVPLPRH